MFLEERFTLRLLRKNCYTLFQFIEAIFPKIEGNLPIVEMIMQLAENDRSLHHQTAANHSV